MSKPDEPLCRSCYLHSVTGGELDRALAEPVVGTVQYCDEHQAQMDHVMGPLLARGLVVQREDGRYRHTGPQLVVDPDLDDARTTLPRA